MVKELLRHHVAHYLREVQGRPDDPRRSLLIESIFSWMLTSRLACYLAVVSRDHLRLNSSSLWGPQNGTIIFISLDFPAQIEEAPPLQYIQDHSSLRPHGTAALSKGPLDVSLMFPPKSGYSDAAQTKRSAINQHAGQQEEGRHHRHPALWTLRKLRTGHCRERWGEGSMEEGGGSNEEGEGGSDG